MNETRIRELIKEVIGEMIISGELDNPSGYLNKAKLLNYLKRGRLRIIEEKEKTVINNSTSLDTAEAICWKLIEKIEAGDFN